MDSRVGELTVQVRAGHVEPAPDPAAALQGGAELVWTALADPAPEELAAAVEALGIAAALIHECRTGAPIVPVPGSPARRNRPRVVEQSDRRGVVLLPAAYDEQHEEVRLGVLTVLEQGAAVLSVSRGPAPDLAALHAEGGHGSPVLAVLSLVVEGYETVLEELDDDVADVEAQVFRSGRGSSARHIYRLKREMLELQRAVLPLVDLVGRLQPPRGLHDRVLRASEHLDRLDNLLDSVLSADLAQVGVRQNEDQRRISAWAAIALVPTVVGAIYGMNFEHMPELSWQYGYPLALALMAAVCTALYVAFTRNGWLGPGSAEKDAADA